MRNYGSYLNHSITNTRYKVYLCAYILTGIPGEVGRGGGPAWGSTAKIRYIDIETPETIQPHSVHVVES